MTGENPMVRPDALDVPAGRERAEVSRAPLLPTIILIGLVKAGTTALHKCLTSEAFRGLAPRPCCAEPKELRFFQRTSAQRETALRELPRSWPVTPSAARRFHPVLDFTPAYISDPVRVIAGIRATYPAARTLNGTGLHFVLVLRDPTTRALSHAPVNPPHV